jgi:ubiquinone/menaquinone biosynthesis C-methylase UbiE
VDAVSRALNFDPLARPYRWLEYVTFGRALERCRFHFLPQLETARRALVIGDGDGRFLARLLDANRDMEADVVDISASMLQILQKKLSNQAKKRIKIYQSDARIFDFPHSDYDLIATHFFLDCLSNEELAAFAARIRKHLKPGGLWVVSEFHKPAGTMTGFIGNLVISGLYLAFGAITGLRQRQLPDYEEILRNQGFTISAERKWLGGLLVSQLWHNGI